MIAMHRKMRILICSQSFTFIRQNFHYKTLFNGELPELLAQLCRMALPDPERKPACAFRKRAACHLPGTFPLFLRFILFIWKGRVMGKVMTVHLFTPEVVTISRAELHQSREPAASDGPRSLVGCQFRWKVG